MAEPKLEIVEAKEAKNPDPCFGSLLEAMVESDQTVTGLELLKIIPKGRKKERVFMVWVSESCRSALSKMGWRIVGLFKSGKIM